MSTQPRPRSTFSREHTYKELAAHDDMIAYCNLAFALSDFIGDILPLDKDDPLANVVNDLERMVDERIGNMVAGSVPGILKQIELFGLRTEMEIIDEDLSMIRSIRAGIEAITEGKLG
jgi:hypothetical protein